MSIIPARWAPASNMWRRGYPITEIAQIINLPASDLKRRIKYLQGLYPQHFPKRRAKLVRITPARRAAVRRVVRAKRFKRISARG